MRTPRPRKLVPNATMIPEPRIRTNNANIYPKKEPQNPARLVIMPTYIQMRTPRPGEIDHHANMYPDENTKT